MSDEQANNPEEQPEAAPPGPESPAQGQWQAPQGAPQYGQPQAPQFQAPPQYGYTQSQFVPPPPQPTNGYAMASIITSSLSMAVLLFTAGLASPITAIASGVGAVLGHKGKDDVDKGKAYTQRDLSVAGMWVGISGLIISILALIAWVVLIAVMIAFDDSTWVQEFNHEFENEWNSP